MSRDYKRERELVEQKYFTVVVKVEKQIAVTLNDALDEEGLTFTDFMREKIREKIREYKKCRNIVKLSSETNTAA